MSWSAAGAVVGSLIDAKASRDASAASAEAANQQMLFQQRMSDTSYQRQVEDLKKAGINPMLVSKLGGASTPAGAMPQVFVPQIGSSFSQIASGLSSAAQASKTTTEGEILEQTGFAQARANLEKTVADIGFTAQQTSKLVKDTELVAEQIATEREKPAQVRAMVDSLIAQTKTEGFKQLNLEQQTKLLQAQIPMYMAKAQLDQNQVRAEMNTENMRRHVEQFGPVGRFVSGAINAAKSIFGK
jgi:DNA polymerase III alpha subunit (gram-positive type)